MPNFFLKDYELNKYEKWTFLFYPAYSSRHFEAGLETANWLGRSIHFGLATVESSLYFGALWALVEKCLAGYNQQTLKNQDVSPIEEDLIFNAEENEDDQLSLFNPVMIKEKSPLDSSFLLEKKANDVEVDSLEDSLSPKLLSKQLPTYSVLSDVMLDDDLTQEKATYQILTTPGFIVDSLHEIPSKYGYAGEIQGNKPLRYKVARLTKLFLQSISPKALKEQREAHLEQYLTIKFKRFAHAFDLKGIVSLPSDKKINLEGFCEAFTIPMIAASFESYTKKSTLFSQIDCQWIVEHFNQTISSDHIESDDIQVLSCILQNPNFIGPLSLGTGHDRHSTATIFFGSYLIYCNRGVGESNPGIYIFNLSDRSLLTEAVLQEITKRQEIVKGEEFGSKRIMNDLGGILIYYEALPKQKAGNCTLISMETALLSFMAIRQVLNLFGDQADITQCHIDEGVWAQIFQIVQKEYKEWWIFDRELVFKDMIEEIQQWIDGKDISFSQNALYDSYQQLLNCWYEKYAHHEPVPGQPFSSLVNLILDQFF